MRQGVRQALGGALLLSLAIHAMTKGAALLPEMLWACHAASLTIVAGVLLRIARLTAVGFLFHVAIGLPGYLLDVLATRATTPTSLLVHVLPLVVGGAELWRQRYPKGVLLPAWTLHATMVLIARWTTEPTLNVNLSHAPWPPAARVLPRLWMSWGFNFAAAFVFLLVGDRCLRRWLGPRTSWSLPQCT